MTLALRLHRALCWFGLHLPYETFRYAPQGFLSDHYVTTHECLVCRVKLPNGKVFIS